MLEFNRQHRATATGSRPFPLAVCVVPLVAAMLALGDAAPAGPPHFASAMSGTPTAGAAGLGHTLLVPFDHDHPAAGKDSIYFEMGARFDPAKPTVIVVADGQQFYIRRGSIAALQQGTFGPEFNVVGIVGRGFCPGFIAAARGADGQPDWKRAWQVFRAGQWVEDIEAVRVAVVGERGAVLLYGVSGGALLVHQYLARHGAHVARALTAVGVEPFLEGELGLNPDHFWEETGGADSSLHALVRRALQRWADDRPALIMTLQRQSFFVEAEQLPAARASLIQGLAAGDSARYAAARKEYQVDEVRKFFTSPEGIPVCVREFELFYPSGGLARLSDGGCHPDLENQYNFARPLIERLQAGEIPTPALDRIAAHHLPTEVLVIAGRWDQSTDYRTQIGLAARYPRGFLFLADDDHLLHRLASNGGERRLMRAFLRWGLDSDSLRLALVGVEALRWREP